MIRMVKNLLFVFLFLLPIYSTAQVPDDTINIDGKIFLKVDEEASFPGGVAEWRSFLERTINPMVPIDNGAPARIYTVSVQFIVDKDGRNKKLSES